MKHAVACAALLLATGILCGWQYTAAPIEKLPDYIESNAAVREALGAPVEVSMVVTRTLDRRIGPDGTEYVTLITTVTGSRREGTLTANATNVDDQGWAGTWEVRGATERVLRDREYVTEGGEVIASGRFDADGTPTE